MEVASVNSNLNIQSVCDNDKPLGEDVFSELFSAVFANFFLNQNIQVQEGVCNNTVCTDLKVDVKNVENNSIDLGLKDLNLSNISTDFIKNSIISNANFINKENKDELDSILKELGINQEDFNKKISFILNNIEKDNDILKSDMLLGKEQSKVVSDQDKNLQTLVSKDITKDEKISHNKMDLYSDAERPSLQEINGEKETKETNKMMLKVEAKEEKPVLNKKNDEIKIDKINIQTENHVNKIKEFTLDKLSDKNNHFVKNSEELVEVIVEKFKTLRVPGFTQVKVKLMPENLGEITVKVVLEKGQINGNIIADKKETANIIMGNIENLKTELKNSNVNFNNISVNIASDENYSDQRNHSSFNNFKENKKNQDNFSEFKPENNKENEDGFSIIA
ncbi:MAG: flagellar hook-length control protein FliK [Caloramator sp.]|nr:flagellar hook-length control protein FliK [Caloramator sp.]